jgi:hypothetical protein
MTGPSETSAARHEVRRRYGTPRLTLGGGHHGVPRPRSTTGRMVGGRGSGDDRTGRRGVLMGYQPSGDHHG